MLANFFGSWCFVFPSSTKREIRHFHVVFVQRRLRNVQKSVQSCCFANLNLLCFFFPFSLPSPSSLLKLPNVYPPATLKLKPCSVAFFAFSGRTEEEPQTKQLEFEDVWLASQVELLQDNFDILGRWVGCTWSGDKTRK